MMENIESILTTVRYQYERGLRIDTMDINATLPLLSTTIKVLARLGPEFQQTEAELSSMVTDLEEMLKQRRGG